jgi:hypothetical protein
METKTEIPEYWRVIEENPLYEISDWGRVRKSENGKIIGDYYFCMLSIDGKRKYFNKIDLLIKYWNTNKRKVIIPSSQRKKTDRKLSKEVMRKREVIHHMTFEQIAEELQELEKKIPDFSWNDEYFLSHFNYTIEQILHKINNEIGCDMCCDLKDLKTLTIYWSRDKYEETTTEFVSFCILRYYIRKRTRKHDSGNAIRDRFTSLEHDEMIVMKTVLHHLFGTTTHFKTMTRKLLDVELMEEDGKEKLLHSTKYKEAIRFQNDTFFMRSSKDDNEWEFEDKPVDLGVFSTVQSDTKLAQRVYNMIPTGYREHTRGNFSFVRLNEIFDNILDKWYPKHYSMCEIFVEFCSYISEDIFTVYKRLSEKNQKIILKEIGKS